MLCETRRKQSVTALIVAGLSFLFVGCGGGVPIAPIPGVGGLGGMVGAGGCSPIPMMNSGYGGAYGGYSGMALSITFQGSAIRPDSIAIQGGIIPGYGPITQLSYSVMQGGLAVPPTAFGTNMFVGNSADGTIQLNVMNGAYPGAYPGMYPGQMPGAYPGQYPGMVPGAYGGGGMGNVTVNGTITMSSLASSNLINQALASAGGYGYGYGSMPMPGYGTPYGSPYGNPYGATPYAQPQVCISGLGLDLSTYAGAQLVYRDVYLSLNNTSYPFKLVF